MKRIFLFLMLSLSFISCINSSYKSVTSDEAMKMMNEIKSEISGKVVEICVEDGQPVEFGQVLMYVE